MRYNPRLSPFYKFGVKDIIFHPFTYIVVGVILLDFLVKKNQEN